MRLSTECFNNFSSIIMDTVEKLQDYILKLTDTRKKLEDLQEDYKKLKVSEAEHARKYEELVSRAAEQATKLIASEKRVVELVEENKRLRNELKEAETEPKKTLLDFILDLFK